MLLLNKEYSLVYGKMFSMKTKAFLPIVLNFSMKEAS